MKMTNFFLNELLEQHSSLIIVANDKQNMNLNASENDISRDVTI